MPDIIEENEEGEGSSVVHRRRALAMRAAIVARAAALNNNNNNINNNVIDNNRNNNIDNNNNNHHHPNPNNNNINNNNNNNNRAPQAAVQAVVPDVAAVAAAAVGGANNNNNNEHHEITTVRTHVLRLVGVDVRNTFRRLGVRRVHDIQYIREKDFDGISRITSIQKRKVWAIMKYVTLGHTLHDQTALLHISKTLNLEKRRDKEGIATTATTMSSSSAFVVPMMQIAKLTEFDGSPTNWLVWKNKTQYALNQTSVAPLLIREGTEGTNFAQKNPGRDQLLFNILAEAIVGGSARHLIKKAEQETTKAAATQAVLAAALPGSNNTTTNNNTNSKVSASGHVLWKLLGNEYSQGPMAFWILSDARQSLQQLHLVCPIVNIAIATTTSSIGYTSIYNDQDNRNNNTYASESYFTGNDNNSSTMDDNKFSSYSAQDYAQRFRNAKDTLEEYQQALPDQFLASTFVEHVYDDRFDVLKKQLLQDISIKNTSLDACINELLMADHMQQARQRQRQRRMPPAKRTAVVGGGASKSNRKRPLQRSDDDDDALLPEHNTHNRLEDIKRLKLGDEDEDDEDNHDERDEGYGDINNEPDAATS